MCINVIAAGCCGGKGKIYGKGMNVARQILRRFSRVTGAQTPAASSDCIVRTVSFGHSIWKIAFL